MKNCIDFVCQVCESTHPDRKPPVMAVAVKNCGNPDEITEDGWSLLVCAERLVTAKAAERALPQSLSLNAIVRSLTPDPHIDAVGEVPQDYDLSIKARYSPAEWHEHDIARRLGIHGKTMAFDSEGKKVLVSSGRVATAPFPTEGIVTLQCSEGHKSLKTRDGLVKAARKAFHANEKSVAIGFVNGGAPKPVISGGRSVGATWALTDASLVSRTVSNGHELSSDIPLDHWTNSKTLGVEGGT